MKVIIIEDEPLIAEALREMLLQCDPSIEIQAELGSIRQTLDYLDQKPLPDLFFSDIQLSDGLSFEIFKAISNTTPVIFCTAFDQYALEAFKVNGIDYVLKPFQKEDIQATLDKLKSLQLKPAPVVNLLEQLQQVEQLIRPKVTQNILIRKGDRITPVKASSLALAILENGITYVYSLSGERFIVDYKLDQLLDLLGPDFYRVNRQILIQREAVRHVSQYFARKLLVEPTIKIPAQLIVSKANASEFLKWLEGG